MWWVGGLPAVLGLILIQFQFNWPTGSELGKKGETSSLLNNVSGSVLSNLTGTGLKNMRDKNNLKQHLRYFET